MGRRATGENLIEEIAAHGDFTVALATYQAKRLPCRYLIHSPLRRNEIEATVAIVGSARNRSRRIPADSDWITKNNQK
jgi:hypothetical protein